MINKFQVSSLDALEFNHFFDLSEKELSSINAIKMIAKTNPGYPCRVSLEDAQIGEEVLLLNYEHHKVNSPYKASGPVFIRRNVKTANLKTNQIPEMLKHRLLSLRAYNSSAIMIESETVKGENLADKIDMIFSNDLVNYIHIHNSGPGCYNCQINRVEET